MTATARRRPAPWLGAYRSPVDTIQRAASTAALIVARYADSGRRVPIALYGQHRATLTALIDKHHHQGDIAIRAARFAIDALDNNQGASACVCGWVMTIADKHDHDEFGAVCGECCEQCP